MVLTDLPGGGPRRTERELREFVVNRADHIVRQKKRRRIAVPAAAMAVVVISAAVGLQLRDDDRHSRVAVVSDEASGPAVELAAASDRGLTAQLTMSPPHPEAGDVVYLTLTVDDTTSAYPRSSETGPDRVPGIDYGDHRPHSVDDDPHSCPTIAETGTMQLPDGRTVPVTEAPNPAFHTHSTYRYVHVFQRPGAYRVAVPAPGASGPCDRDDRAPLAGTLTIGGSAMTGSSNGPLPPFVGLQEGPTSAAGEHAFLVVAGDDDGAVRTIRVKWGDGGRDEVLTVSPADECTVPRTWPATRHRAQVQHHVGADLTVSVSVESLGCDGRDEQTSSTTMTVHQTVTDERSSWSHPTPASGTVETQ